MTDLPAPAPDADKSGRYGARETGDGAVVVFDREEPTAWIKSDVVIDLDPD